MLSTGTGDVAPPKYKPQEDVEGKIKSGGFTTNLGTNLDIMGFKIGAASFQLIVKHVGNFLKRKQSTCMSTSD
jgi:hypothetical protein